MSMFEWREIFTRVVHWVSIITVMGFMLFVTGCLVDSNDGTSPEFQINTPMVLDISGRWDINLDQDTTFAYETSFEQIRDVEEQNDSLRVLKRISFQIEARKNGNNPRQIFISGSITGDVKEGERYPVRRRISNDEFSRILNGENTIARVSTNYAELLNLGEENEGRLNLGFISNSGHIEIVRFDGERLKATIDFSSDLIGGRELIYVSRDSANVTEYEPDTNAVQIESLIDIPIGKIKNNRQSKRP